jgi:anthranilate phosphoribosyltransferase
MTNEYQSAAFTGIGGWPAVLSQLFARGDLSRETTTLAFGEILAGRAEPVQIAAFVAALRTKGETVDEIAGCIQAMREHGQPLAPIPGAIDTCGTGGDRSGTINVSTCAALIAAACGAKVVKHGNRAASSRTGSADVLEALGVVIELGPTGVEACVEASGLGFCFAPRYHPAMRHAGPVRRELGAATIFNILGPLANPARVTRQAVGVGDPTMAEKMLDVLVTNGAEHALVFYGHDGLDELSTVANSTVFESHLDETGHRSRTTYEVDPRKLGLGPAALDMLRGGEAAENANRIRLLLEGERGPQRDLILLNGAAALIVAGIASNLEDGLTLGESAIDSGRAADVLERFVVASKAAAEAALI